jgi:signal transduction histidine kinase
MGEPLLQVRIEHEQDVVAARRRAREVAGLLGFDAQDQSRIATAVSEIARNAFQYAGGGEVTFAVDGNGPAELLVRITDRGPGIQHLAEVLDGRYVSRTGLGLGIRGARRLMDRFEARFGEEGGTTVLLGKSLSGRAAGVASRGLAELKTALGSSGATDVGEEVHRQNLELLAWLDELRARQLEVERLNRELEETNRGVVALYMELDERAQDLARAADLKSRVLSDISHEVRTPLNAILNVTRLLVDRVDGDLTAEQARQVQLIRSAAATLRELVSDLLELARMEAGKTTARVVEFTVADLFAALRGVFRPLLPSEQVELAFDDVSELPPLRTDEGKLGQILRNLISNALKFTERGEVRVSAALRGDDRIAFAVSDTGIGIAPEDLDRIFQEFTQIDNPLQRRAQGAGLGLPLSRKLTEFLGGSLDARSVPGQGSTFTAVIPREYSERRSSERGPTRAAQTLTS